MSDRVKYYKIIIAGDGAVGKTAIRHQYFGEGFKATYMMTIGADFAVKRVELDGKEYILHFWDLAGQPRFKDVRELYYKNADGIILVFDLSRPTTFENLPNWLEELNENVKKPLKEFPLVLLGNKVDLRGEPGINVLTHEEGKEYSISLGTWIGRPVNYFETSALAGINIDSAFTNLIRQLN